MDTEPVSVSAVRELVIGGSVIVGGLYSLLRFIFEPRLHKTIDAKIDAATEPLEARMHKVETAEAATSSAVHQVGEDVKRVTLIMEKLAEQSLAQGRSLAYIEGTMRSRAPRVPWQDGQSD